MLSITWSACGTAPLSFGASIICSHNPASVQRRNCRSTLDHLSNSSGRSRHGAPIRAIQKIPSRTRRWVVGLRAFGQGAGGQGETLKERPFLVRHQVACQAGLHCRYQLESSSAGHVNPFCQHGLRHNIRPVRFQMKTIKSGVTLLRESFGCISLAFHAGEKGLR